MGRGRVGGVVVGTARMGEVVRGRVSEVVETRPSVVVVGSGGSVTVEVVRGSGSVVVVGGATVVEVGRGRGRWGAGMWARVGVGGSEGSVERVGGGGRVRA